MATCCDHHDALNEYDIHGDDPTLSACCLKDLKEQKEYVRIKTILESHDVVQHRLAHRQVSAPTPVPITPSPAMQLDEDDDDEFDYLLDDESIDTQRRDALRAKLALKEQGLGVVWDDNEFRTYHARLTARKTEELIANKQNRPSIVACRPVPQEDGRPIVDTLALALLHCAEKYLGTCFYAVSPACAPQLRELCRHSLLDTGVLIALNALGEYISHTSLVDFDEDSWYLLPWLIKTNALRDTYTPPSSSQQPSKASNDPDDVEDSGYDCGFLNLIKAQLESRHLELNMALDGLVMKVVPPVLATTAMGLTFLSQLVVASHIVPSQSTANKPMPLSTPTQQPTYNVVWKGTR
ncbi:hypothetical protein Ae201684P_018801 [Aphanomyces euteiches]|nr:hypothetical protein Ae201684P_018801 [Aphanomyces euteiches]